MSKPNYRVIFNADDTWPFIQAPDPVTIDGVARVVDNAAEGGVDVFLVNPQSQKANYPSKVWETFWDDFTPGDVSKVICGEGDPQVIHDLLLKMLRVSEQCDYLEMMLARCRRNGIVPGVTIRMNDMHDAPWAPKTWLFSKFYADHPEYYIKEAYARGWGARGFDYEHPEVRQYYLDLIGEIVTSYDLEVLELDFLRFANYFDRNDPERHCQTMTGFIEAVRGLIDRTGKHIHLIPRVAATVAGAYELGFDVRTWAEKGLIDGLSTGHFLSTGWQQPIDAYREIVGPDVGLYAYADSTAARMDGLPPIYMHISREHQRGFAAGYLALGADGVGTFNWYYGETSDYGMTAREFHAGLGDMTSLEKLRPMPRRHLLTAGMSDIECDTPVQVPQTISWATGCSRQFDMICAAEAPGTTAIANVVFDGCAQPGELWLHINDRPVGYADRIVDGPRTDWQGKPYKELKRESHIARFPIPSGLIKDGRNALVVRYESPEREITVLGIEVRIA